MTGYRLHEILLALLGVALLGGILTVRSCRQTQTLQARRADLETLQSEVRHAYADGDPDRAAADPRDRLDSFQLAPGAVPGAPPRLLVDINAAGEAELQRLPGIGPARARDIIATREQLGGFKTLQDLLQVPGIGEKTLAKIAPEISLGQPVAPTPAPASAPMLPGAPSRGSPAPSRTPAATPAPTPFEIPAPTPVAPLATGPVNINTASVQELTRLSGIGEKKALAIIEHRRLHGPFQYPSDITQVKGIGEQTFIKNRSMIVVR